MWVIRVLVLCSIDLNELFLMWYLLLMIRVGVFVILVCRVKVCVFLILVFIVLFLSVVM